MLPTRGWQSEAEREHAHRATAARAAGSSVHTTRPCPVRRHRPQPIARRRRLPFPLGCPAVHIAVIQPTHPDIIARLKPGRPVVSARWGVRQRAWSPWSRRSAVELAACDTARSRASSAQRPKLSSSSRTTPASATGRRPCSAARRAASAHWGTQHRPRSPAPPAPPPRPLPAPSRPRTPPAPPSWRPADRPAGRPRDRSRSPRSGAPVRTRHGIVMEPGRHRR
jgi:hypothetical protein